MSTQSVRADARQQKGCKTVGPLMVGDPDGETAMVAVQQQKQAVYGESALIPKERYTSRDWLKLEYERLWPRVWQMACRLEEIPNRGDYVEYTIGSQSVLIVRESAEGIRAYRNSCLHRGTRLPAGCGAVRNNVILCRFHGGR